jgi:hypothetical protein
VAKQKREIRPQEPIVRNTVDSEMDWLVRKFFTHLWHNDHGSDTDLQRAVNLIEAVQQELDRLRQDSVDLREVERVLSRRRRTIPRSA